MHEQLHAARKAANPGGVSTKRGLVCAGQSSTVSLSPQCPESLRHSMTAWLTALRCLHALGDVYAWQK